MTDVRIITQSLGGSPLSRALQSGQAPSGWMERAPAGADAWRERAVHRQHEREWRLLWRCLEPALAAAGAARQRLDRVIAGNGVVVTTGQQPGLFGGPLYAFTKALSAVALADALERAIGLPVAPVYWAATDDADFEEASVTTVAIKGGLEVLRDAAAPPPGTPMSLARLGDLSPLLERLAAASGSAADPRPLAAVRDAYTSSAGATVGGAFVQLLRALLEPLGMPVLDASHEAVAAASNPTLRRALSSSAEIQRALEDRARELRGAGFDPQVDDVAGLSLVFSREGTVKRRLTVGEDASPAARLTPNVLLRPVVEREILPTVAYVAGPGELAYFVQVSRVAHALGLKDPLAVPRWSCTIIEPQIEALLQRLHATEHDLAPDGALEGRLAREATDPAARDALARLRGTLSALPEWLRDSAEALDLERAVQGAVGAMLHRADRLERRLVAAVKRRESALMTDVATLRAAVRPQGVRQERVLNPIPMLARHGLALLSDMREAASPHADAVVAGRTD